MSRAAFPGIVSLLLAGGCYTYSSIDLASAAPGSQVRARVSAARAAQIGPSIGMTDARLLSGPVVTNDAEGLTIRIPTAPIGTIGAEDGLYQQLLINRGDILEVESKQLDRTRTSVAIGAAVVGATAMVVTAFRGGHSTGSGAVTEPPSNFTIGFVGLRPVLLVRARSIRAARPGVGGR
jgi:hypothetical protein